MGLKPQDTLLVLKYWSLQQIGQQDSVRDIAESIGISASEVSKGSQRLIASRLVVERHGRVYAELGALLEWLCYGVRYAYPVESAGYGRGMATSWNSPELVSEIVPPNPPLAWPVAGGDIDGILIKPIHASVPFASSRDKKLYHVLSLIEAVRGGKPRELSIARRLLTDLIQGKI